jgi:hypothetical protein
MGARQALKPWRVFTGLWRAFPGAPGGAPPWLAGNHALGPTALTVGLLCSNFYQALAVMPKSYRIASLRMVMSWRSVAFSRCSAAFSEMAAPKNGRKAQKLQWLRSKDGVFKVKRDR